MELTLFDLDGTLLPIDSDHAFGEYLVAIGWADAAEFRRRNDTFYHQYLLGELDVAGYVEFATAPWRDRPDAVAMRERFVAEIIDPALRPPALDLVRAHQAAGDLVAIVTATNEFVTAPIAQAFGVQHLLALKLARDAAGRLTGGIEGVPTYREGKVTRVDEWLGGLDLRRSAFERVIVYSDSTNDLALLEQATDPVATNPSAALEAIALERGWRVLKLFA